MKKLFSQFYEPWSTITHLAGLVAALIGLVLLLRQVQGDRWKVVVTAVYGLSLVGLYAASSLLHGVKGTATQRMWLNRLDHAAIFAFIAGTYTPIAYTLFAGAWRWLLLGTVWGISLIGMGYKLLSKTIHGFFNRTVYLLLSWGAVLPATNIWQLVPARGLALLLLGGLFYTGGFVIYYRQWPNPWPKQFGHHEIWHLCVLAGSLSHYLFIFNYILPHQPGS